jgi:DNA-binding NtrC family response regulator
VNWFETVVACPDAGRRTSLLDILGQCGLQPKSVASLSDVRDVLSRSPVHLLFCEDVLPDGDFRDALWLAKATGVPLVVTSLLGELDEYLEAMELGAFDFIAPPYRQAEVESIVSSVQQNYLPTAIEGTLLSTPDVFRDEEAVA